MDLFFAAFQTKLQRANAMRGRIYAMRHRRIANALQEAHLPMMVNAAHNAMLAYESGKPWPEVNYSKLRLALRLMHDEFKAGEICERFSARLIKEFPR